MSEDKETKEYSFISIGGLTLLIILCIGDPDLLDGLINLINAYAEKMKSCK